MKIGSKIRELRREKMWTQKDLGNALQMGVGAIANWETGRSTPSKNAIKEMAKLFGVPVEYLTSDGAEKPKDGSEEATALLKVAENEIKQLKADKEKLMNEIAWYKNENDRLCKEVLSYKGVMEENVNLRNVIVQMAMKGVLTQ